MSERGSYRSIPNALFSGPDFRRLSERARWIFVVLKMNVNAAGIDVWYPDELVIRLASESGASHDQVRLTLDILEHENWIRRDDNLIWVVGHLAHDPHLSAHDAKHRKNVQKIVAGLPHADIVRQFIVANPAWFPASEAIAMDLQWALQGPSKALRRGAAKSKRGSDGPSKQETRLNEEETTAAPNDGAGGEVAWPRSWAHDTSHRLLSHGVVIPVGLIGQHTKPLKDSIAWSEWLRVVDRIAKSGACQYGWPAVLRRLSEFRDTAQPDPNRDLTLSELEELSA